VAKGLFLCKRARPNIQQAILVLYTRVKDPIKRIGKADESDEISERHQRRKSIPEPSDDLQEVKWYVDASFAVHPDFKSHTGAMMMLGKGAMQSIARKQKMNVQSSTEGKLVAVEDAATMILWTKLFLEAQGYNVKKNSVYQDNKSAIWKQMLRRLQESEHALQTFVTSLQPIRWRRETYRLNTVGPTTC
jgi:hypothetical protein